MARQAIKQAAPAASIQAAADTLTAKDTPMASAAAAKAPHTAVGTLLNRQRKIAVRFMIADGLGAANRPCKQTNGAGDTGRAARRARRKRPAPPHGKL
jgi:hypothetical protein